jgi:hypothetical protein
MRQISKLAALGACLALPLLDDGCASREYRTGTYAGPFCELKISRTTIDDKPSFFNVLGVSDLPAGAAPALKRHQRGSGKPFLEAYGAGGVTLGTYDLDVTDKTNDVIFYDVFRKDEKGWPGGIIIRETTSFKAVIPKAERIEFFDKGKPAWSTNLSR